MPALPSRTMSDAQQREAIAERDLLAKRIARLSDMLTGSHSPSSESSDRVLREALDTLREEHHIVNASIESDRILRVIAHRRRADTAMADLARAEGICPWLAVTGENCHKCEMPF